jgi:hypothetical protein
MIKIDATAAVSTMVHMAVTAMMAAVGNEAAKGSWALRWGLAVTARSGAAPRRVCVEGTPSPSGMNLE